MQNEQKRQAAEASIAFVEPGMKVGLGSGSTAEIMVELLGAKVREGLTITGLPTSERTAALARQNGIQLTSFDAVDQLDLTIDGADEFDDQLRLIKGGGGALLREKIVAAQSDRMIVIADQSKLVPELGAYPLPVEVIPFAAAAVMPKIADLGCQATIRKTAGGELYKTDENNLIFDCAFERIEDPESLAAKLNATPGIVEHGLFIGLSERALLGTPNGVKTIR